MKTIGEIIHSARIHKGLSLEDIAKQTKIDVKYIDALEKDQLHKLPPTTFTKGFIRNIAKVLGKSPDDLIAIYRRDLPNKPSVEVKLSSQPTQPAYFNKSTVFLLLSGLLVFFGYLAFQYRALLIPPPLEVTQPQDKAVVTSPVTVEGKTSADSLVAVNPNQESSSQTDVKPDGSGLFLTQINLSPGDHKLTITATNRFGRSASKDISITVLSSD